MEINWSDLFRAIALLMILEGILPFLRPAAMRRMMRSMIELDDRTLRITGLVIMLSGLSLLYLL